MSKSPKKDGWTRPELVAAVLYLRSHGLSHAEIAPVIGRSRGTVSTLVTDPLGEKRRLRVRLRYSGICVECGHRTAPSKEGPPSLRCIWCAQGLDRPASAIPRLDVPFRLTELPLEVRLEAAIAAGRSEGPHERLELLAAAANPSTRTYFVSRSAGEILDALRAA